MKASLVLLLGSMSAGCGGGENEIAPEDKVTIAEGVWGTVTMASYGSDGRQENALSTEIRIYAPTREDQVTRVDRLEISGAFEEPPTDLVVETTTDDAGFYEMAAAPGPYSVFVYYDGIWVCDEPGAEGLCVVTVEVAEALQHDVSIWYETGKG